MLEKVTKNCWQGCIFPHGENIKVPILKFHFFLSYLVKQVARDESFLLANKDIKTQKSSSSLSNVNQYISSEAEEQRTHFPHPTTPPKKSAVP